MPDSVYEQIASALRAQAIPFDVTEHAPVYTSEEAAAILEGLSDFAKVDDASLIRLEGEGEERVAEIRVRIAGAEGTYIMKLGLRRVEGGWKVTGKR